MVIKTMVYRDKINFFINNHLNVNFIKKKLFNYKYDKIYEVCALVHYTFCNSYLNIINS